MENLNGFNFYRKGFIDWDEIDYIIENTLNCEYITLDEVERCEEDIRITFKIKDTSKGNEIKSCLKSFLAEGDYDYVVDTFNDIDYVCEEAKDKADEYDISIDKEIYLKVIENHLNKSYDINIKVQVIEASYDCVGVLFEIAE